MGREWSPGSRWDTASSALEAEWRGCLGHTALSTEGHKQALLLLPSPKGKLDRASLHVSCWHQTRVTAAPTDDGSKMWVWEQTGFWLLAIISCGLCVAGTGQGQADLCVLSSGGSCRESGAGDCPWLELPQECDSSSLMWSPDSVWRLT